MSGLHDILLDLEAAAEPKAFPRLGAEKKRFAELAAPLLFERKRRRLESLLSAEIQLEEVGIKEAKAVGSLDLALYLNKINECEKGICTHKEETDKTCESVKELRRVYLYGLQKVSKLQDLREAPDAIMPGNFVVRN